MVIRSSLLRTANLCVKAALGDNCVIVTHPARTLRDLKITLSRSRNSTRSTFFLACLNWLQLLNFSGSILICTSREIGIHFIFFSKGGVWGEETQKCWLRITDTLACFDLLGTAVLKGAAVMNSKVHQGCFNKATPKTFLWWQLYLLLWGEKQYINRAQSAGWTLLTLRELADSCQPWFWNSLHLSFPWVIWTKQQFACITSVQRCSWTVVPRRLRKWHHPYADETRFFCLSMLWCLAIFFLIVGRCPESASSVSKMILELFKSSTSAPFHLFPPRILVYFSKLLNCKLWRCNTEPGSWA